MELDFKHQVPSFASHVECFLCWVICDAITDIVTFVVVRELVLGLYDFHLIAMQLVKVDHFDNLAS